MVSPGGAPCPIERGSGGSATRRLQGTAQCEQAATDNPDDIDWAAALQADMLSVVRQAIEHLVGAGAATEWQSQVLPARRGSYHPTLWEVFDTVTKASEEASDHHLVWALRSRGLKVMVRRTRLRDHLKLTEVYSRYNANQPWIALPG